MNSYIRDLIDTIHKCDMTTTYKMSWCRSLVERSVISPNERIIYLKDMAPMIFRYYWNQSIFFNLNQGTNLVNKPTIHQTVLNEIERYKTRYGPQPKVFSKVQNKINIDTRKIVHELKRYVWKRFDDKEKFYKRNNSESYIELYHPELLSEYSDILNRLINYRWIKKLEKINTQPRISKKVIDGYKENIKRPGNLKGKFGEFIRMENPDMKCFMSGEKIEIGELSIDHVIPWSYIYSDDLWNLVFVSKSKNSSKGSKPPDKEMIEKLEQRNKRLEDIMKTNGEKNKHYEDLKFANETNLVKSSWLACSG